ncbi:hypothetical protein THAOC_25124 [Thalassiosira oceanica]|uniref:Uncharacterized protein n=1 Tax=Thalassiosira oceanica TaxID=159749 RepID=K0RS79_THAOC|nr:hypothetical protein THAOC_25124 [Thalassiosira oceanica]|eukprot:EJK55174.1 hypothetical protein THAOC_25124 [Thalassiosira oceanica]
MWAAQCSLKAEGWEIREDLGGKEKWAVAGCRKGGDIGDELGVYRQWDGTMGGLDLVFLVGDQVGGSVVGGLLDSACLSITGGKRPEARPRGPNWHARHD